MSRKKQIPISPEEQIEIGEVIKSARKDLGWSQQELAEILDVSTQTVSNWEKGRYLPADNKINKVAEVLGNMNPELLRPAVHNKTEREWKEAYRKHQQKISKDRRVLRRILPEFLECYGIELEQDPDGPMIFKWEGHDVTVSECWEKLYPIVGEVFKDLILRYGEDHGYLAKYGEKKGGSDNGQH